MNTLYAIDFDDTLNYTQKIKGYDFNPNMPVVNFCKDKNFVIVTARRDSESNRKYIAGFLKAHSLPYVDMYFTNGLEKAETLKALIEHSDVDEIILIDDNESQRMSIDNIMNKNISAIHPLDVSNRKVALFNFFNKTSKNIIFKQNKDYINFSKDKEYKENSLNVEFVNELGNDIKIKAEIDRKNNLEYYYLKITMEGPNSISENTITQMEAEELYKILKEIL